ncbi:unnamed protein product [Spirodela intermedia]|uniref:BRX domain-containing protein n=1 Tax=Spirodela intermedia TaxID=51605 RepID=A0A7I8JUJ0_SPIIN|nr:unnamed protein product [Spirodela intermedia]CAA6673860.1 unnamed protein product [Spirodela intermedia]
MLTCIACSKQLADAGEDEPARGIPRTKDTVKSLTSQIKEMMLKFSGAYRHSKPYGGGVATGGTCRKGGFSSGIFDSHPYGDFDAVSEAGEDLAGRHQYLRTGCSSSSTPGWDFASVNVASSDDRFAIGEDRSGNEDRLFEEVLVEDDGAAKEWVAQVEPGVHVTFLSIPGGGNDLKRIRFSREMFNKWQAQRWWGENYDRIMELYNVHRFSRNALPTSLRSDYDGPATPRPGMARKANGSSALLPVPDPTEHILHYNPNFPMAASGAPWKGEEAPLAHEVTGDPQETAEWVAQDQPGVYITIRQLPDGTRELRRVRFSREQFAEKNAKRWWELNQERIQAQYL